ncbi:galactoside 2-alpha-L-fucosyltransferase 1-like [Mizuhopecten yessoensis]|uniref:L-Fucosyltransferase n=1 Tax=Mizuhopecten yessoensis TaxID=6573 RepID=A0A210R350_MIZYE|nr:galactoside 2-alpha-L-fucosyltransferase 1-like [Mizuhopecten yessoensis]OWF55439.1 Galactoside 2-alpha-L-fucosyltransferase 1 [Mizuhopecten yessoensis]
MGLLYPQKRLFLLFVVLSVVVTVVLLFMFSYIEPTDHDATVPVAENTGHSRRKRIAVSFWGRTGNHIFEYAALIGTADRNNMTPVIVENTDLVDLFDFQIPKLTVQNPTREFEVVNERLAGAYNPEVEKLKDLNKDVYLKGYLQSWKYFHPFEKKLKQKYFKFKDNLLREADEFLNQARTHLRKSKNSLYIGVHIRRGDFVRAKSRGYGAVPVPYFYRAMNYYLKKYKDVIFVVCSNGLTWCKDNLDSDFYPIQYSTLGDSGADLALLSRCNHSIISVGSFSWWSGYLAGGEVVYPVDAFPVPNTSIGDSYVRADYFLPGWTRL